MKTKQGMVLAVALALVGSTAHAAPNIFLRVDGIVGESVSPRGQIAVSSVELGAAKQSAHGGYSKPKIKDLLVRAPLDMAGPELWLAVVTGRHHKRAVLTFHKTGREYLKVTLDDVLVSSYAVTASSTGSDVPMSEFSLNFARIRMEYTRVDAKGRKGPPLRVGYDLKANKVY